MSVHVTYHPDPADRAAAARAVAGGSRWEWIAPVAATTVSAVAVAFVAPEALAEGGVPRLVVEMLPWVLFTAFWIAIVPLKRRREARTLLERDPSGAGVQRRSVDEAGLHIRGEGGVQVDVPWHLVARCVETDESFLFYTDPHRAHLLPKRALRASEARLVRGFARTALGERARLGAG